MSNYASVQRTLVREAITEPDDNGDEFETGSVSIVGTYSMELSDDLKRVTGLRLNEVTVTVRRADLGDGATTQTITLDADELAALDAAIDEAVVAEAVS